MAHTKAWLTKRVKIDGKWKVKQPFYNRSGSLSDKVLVGAERRLVPGVFVMEWYDETGKRRRRTLGTSPFEAQIELEHQSRRLADLAEGRPVVKEADHGKHCFESAAEAYYSSLRNKEREPKTIKAIQQNLELLQECTGRSHIEEINQTDVTETFVQALRTKGYSRQTVFDRYARVVSFLKFCAKKYGCKRVVELGDGPPRPKPKYDSDIGKKDPYTDMELTKLFSVCTDEERLLFAFFLGTGAREKEVIYSTWKDLDLEHRLFHIRSKERMGFLTKDRSSRSVPFNQELANALRVWKGKSDSLFVFPHKGKPQLHMIRILKKRALQAGLNCGMCVMARSECCTDKPVCENWYLHRFRHTFANFHLRSGVDVSTVQEWLGHSDLATTAIYTRAIKSKSAETKAKVDATFANVVTGLRRLESFSIQ